MGNLLKLIRPYNHTTVRPYKKLLFKSKIKSCYFYELNKIKDVCEWECLLVSELSLIKKV